MTDNALIDQSVKEIPISWHVDDVIGLRPDLNETDAIQVLKLCKRSHDANVGNNWDVIAAASLLFGDPPESID